MASSDLQAALDHLKAGGFKLGTDWEEAHEICQAHEGTQIFDWTHALIHRIEGDDRNAAYWYNRAGKERHDGSVEEEFQTIQAASASQ